jgi:hypothetical protein
MKSDFNVDAASCRIARVSAGRFLDGGCAWRLHLHAIVETFGCARWGP